VLSSVLHPGTPYPIFAFNFSLFVLRIPWLRLGSASLTNHCVPFSVLRFPYPGASAPLSHRALCLRSPFSVFRVPFSVLPSPFSLCPISAINVPGFHPWKPVVVVEGLELSVEFLHPFRRKRFICFQQFDIEFQYLHAVDSDYCGGYII